MDESLVHLLSELPQLLTQQGWQLAEATQKVEQLQLDVRDIIGEVGHQKGDSSLVKPLHL